MGATAGRVAPGSAAATSYRWAASAAMAAEMSVAVTAAPRRARGMARDPVPHPASHTVLPFTPPPSSSHASTLSSVSAWPSRMSRWTCTVQRRRVPRGTVGAGVWGRAQRPRTPSQPLPTPSNPFHLLPTRQPTAQKPAPRLVDVVRVGIDAAPPVKADVVKVRLDRLLLVAAGLLGLGRAAGWSGGRGGGRCVGTLGVGAAVGASSGGRPPRGYPGAAKGTLPLPFGSNAPLPTTPTPTHAPAATRPQPRYPRTGAPGRWPPGPLPRPPGPRCPPPPRQW